MKPIFHQAIVTTVLVIASVAAQPAVAGPYSDELAKCLVGKTTNDDKATLMTWIFSAIALNPGISRMASISAAQQQQIDGDMGTLVERLMTETCRAETRAAVQYEGNSAIERGFQVLGEVAGRELFASPEVAKGLNNLNSHIDMEKLKAVFNTTE